LIRQKFNSNFYQAFGTHHERLLQSPRAEGSRASAGVRFCLNIKRRGLSRVARWRLDSTNTQVRHLRRIRSTAQLAGILVSLCTTRAHTSRTNRSGGTVERGQPGTALTFSRSALRSFMPPFTHYSRGRRSTALISPSVYEEECFSLSPSFPLLSCFLIGSSRAYFGHIYPPMYPRCIPNPPFIPRAPRSLSLFFLNVSILSFPSQARLCLFSFLLFRSVRFISRVMSPLPTRRFSKLAFVVSLSIPFLQLSGLQPLTTPSAVES